MTEDPYEGPVAQRGVVFDAAGEVLVVPADGGGDCGGLAVPEDGTSHGDTAGSDGHRLPGGPAVAGRDPDVALRLWLLDRTGIDAGVVAPVAPLDREPFTLCFRCEAGEAGAPDRGRWLPPAAAADRLPADAAEVVREAAATRPDDARPPGTGTPFDGQVTQKGLVFGPDGALLMVRSGDKPWTPAGGRVEAGERPRAALRRELREETGLSVSVDRPVAAITEVWYTGDAEPMYAVVYRATAADRGVELNDEHEEYRWFDPERAIEVTPLEQLCSAIELARDGP